jgi:hypothetical protein
MNAPVPGPRTPCPKPPSSGRHSLRWPETGSWAGAILYAFIGALILWFLVDILPHVHIAVSWH